jgi:hypothetical protein
MQCCNLAGVAHVLVLLTHCCSFGCWTLVHGTRFQLYTIVLRMPGR